VTGEVGSGVQNGQMTVPDVSIGVIGGSGLYSLFEPGASERLAIATPYGEAVVTVGRFAERHVAFLTRHGYAHSLAPHRINYRANVWALASLGVKAIVSSSAVGGVDPDYPPGTLVVTDQFIDRTQARSDTFYDEGSVQHLPAADPFCPTLNATARTVLHELGEQFRSTGTAVVIQGPRFSTRAESVWFRSAGAHTVNMTLYPEVVLASELNIGTVNLSFVTDSDSGLAPADGSVGDDVVSGELVFERLAAARPRIVAALGAIIAAIPDNYPGRQLIEPAAVAAVLERSPL
jgi:5'-methylthioadenosine phosphorylase